MKDYPELLKTTTNRRNFLRGAGICLLLPQMVSVAGEKNTQTPTRVAWLQVPNGKIMDKWKPKGSGSNYALSPTLQPLKSFKKDFSVYGGLEHMSAEERTAGDHARAQGTFLTGTPILKDRNNFRNGISVDQVAAKALGTMTYLPSLELSAQRGRRSGACDSGYNCAYQYNLSWASEKKPMSPETDTLQAFNRLFVNDEKKSKERMEALAHQKSILDYMLESSKSLKRKLAREDIDRLDQYYTSVRELERKMQSAKPSLAGVKVSRDFKKEPESYAERIETFMDLMVLAWEVDATRICTMIVGKESSNATFKELGIEGGHHSISHHGGNKEKIKQLEKIDLFYVNKLAYFLQKLKEREVNGKSLLEQSMVLYGSGISDGQRHKHNDLPIILAGHANGNLKPGEYKAFNPTPLCNLYVTMLHKLGVPVEKFGDSNGALKV